MDKGIETAFLPDGEMLLDAMLDVRCPDASMLATKDAGNKCGWAFGVPLAVLEVAEFSGQLDNDSGTDVAWHREVERVGVGNDCVILLQQALDVGNSIVEVAAIIAVDGIIIDCR